MTLAGRPAIAPMVGAARPLTVAEARAAQSSKAPAVRELRDSHHMMARLFAMGLRSGEVAQRSGYSLARVSMLHNDPSFQELIAYYRATVDQEWRASVDEYFDTVNANRITSARLLNDKLNSGEHDDFTVGQLVSIHADAADRTGYGKRSTQVNINMDFAAKLEAANRRSRDAKTIDHQPSPVPSPAGETGEGSSESPPARALPRTIVDRRI